MATTYKAIASATVGAGGAGTIEFTSIPQIYTDLLIYVSARSDRSLYVDDYRIALNGTTSTFWYRAMTGDGTSVATYSGITNSNVIGVTSAANATASTFSNGWVYITNYANTSLNKSFLADSASENNATSAQIWSNGDIWISTAAITSITIDQGDGSNWLQYSTAYLYGIKNSQDRHMAITKLSNSGIATGGVLKYDSMLAGNAAFVPTAFDSISTVTVDAGGTSSVSFTSIPSTYQNLQLRFVAKTTIAGTGSGGEVINMTMNGTSFADSAYVYASNTTLATNNNSGVNFLANLVRADDTSIFTAGIVDIFDYADTNKNTTIRTIGGYNRNGTGSEMSLNINVWNSTTAISSLTITPSSGNFPQNSRFALYGIRGV